MNRPHFPALYGEEYPRPQYYTRFPPPMYTPNDQTGYSPRPSWNGNDRFPPSKPCSWSSRVPNVNQNGNPYVPTQFNTPPPQMNLRMPNEYRGNKQQHHDRRCYTNRPQGDYFNQPRGTYQNENSKKNKVAKRDLPQNNKYFCDSCDRGFKLEEVFQTHVAEHQKCSVKDCPYIAAPKLVKLHHQTQHKTGLAKKIWELESKEDIKKWVQERKRNFPTSDNIAKKKQLNAELAARGEVLKTEYFGKMNNGRKWNKRNSDSKDGKNSGRKRKWQRRFNRRGGADGDEETVNRRGGADGDEERVNRRGGADGDEETVNKQQKLETGEEPTDAARHQAGSSEDLPVMQVQTTDDKRTVDRCINPLLKSAIANLQADETPHASEPEDFKLQSTDPEHISTSVELSSNSEELRLASEELISTGGELISGSEELTQSCEELIQSCANIMPVTVEQISDDRELKSVNAELGSGSAELFSITAELVSYNVEQKLENAEQASDNADLLPADNTSGKTNNSDQSRRPNFKDRNYARRGRRRQRNRNQKSWRVNRETPAVNSKGTLLQQLLASDIRHERNVILQCVRHIVKKNFFMAKPIINNNHGIAKSETEILHNEDQSVILH